MVQNYYVFNLCVCSASSDVDSNVYVAPQARHARELGALLLLVMMIMMMMTKLFSFVLLASYYLILPLALYHLSVLKSL